MMNRIVSQRVGFMPKQLLPGILYVSEEYKTAAHLCACGCGEKIRTPLTPTEWRFTETLCGPSLFPSIGNWQKKCQSHYWINQGEIRWAENWSPEQIAAGRQEEEARRRSYYEPKQQERGSPFAFWDWIFGWIQRFFK